MQSQVGLGRITTNKASGGDGIPGIQIVKDDAVKVLHSICQQVWKTLSSGHRTGKGQFLSQFQGRAMPKNVQTIT